MKQHSDNHNTFFSMQDIRNNSKLNISGVVTTGGADRRRSPGRDLHVTVPVLTQPDERLCVYESWRSDAPGFSTSLLLLNELMLLQYDCEKVLHNLIQLIGGVIG